MFWSRDEIDWQPGSGNHTNGFRLLGRHKKNLPALRLADFRTQTGVYILYDDWGPYYVGLTRKKGIGDRLKDHVLDDHAERWNRFSWFGFRSVTGKQTSLGLHELGVMPKRLLTDSDKTIGDIEALLINVLNARGNNNDMKFARADCWEQVARDETEYYINKVRP